MLLHDEFVLHPVTDKLTQSTCIWCHHWAVASNLYARLAYQLSHKNHCERKGFYFTVSG